MKPEIQEALKKLPAVDETLRAMEHDQDKQWPHWALAQAVREETDSLRQRVMEGQLGCTSPDPDVVEQRVRTLLAPSLKPVINASGVVVHTNLGRSPLGARVMDRIARISAGYSNLEYRLEERGRGSRHDHVRAILRKLCEAEDALVVNNNAGAVLLALAALAAGREVIVSRGELIEIGGSFRIPEVMEASGAVLKEVGATNRTHVRDYEQAINEKTALLLKAHQSNFAQVGFVKEVSAEELVAIGRARGVPTLFDLGSGCLIDMAGLGLPGELTVQQAVKSGLDLTTFSGDKLLGGPQAGIVVGRTEVVDRLRRHPLMRALRPDKMTLAALEATLEAYRDGDQLIQLPALAMLAASGEELKRRASRVRARLRRIGSPWRFDLIKVTSRVGGGALPQASLGSWAVTIQHPDLGANAIEERLRRGDPPVIARIEEECLLLDMRTIEDRLVSSCCEAVVRALG